jgi:eukaryotic-like serine/threonine-protein kinase
MRGPTWIPPLEGSAEKRLVDEGEIARGGMGTIRRAFDRSLLRRVAMKVLVPTAAADPIEVRRFVEEAQITGQLDHPNIPPVYVSCAGL